MEFPDPYDRDCDAYDAAGDSAHGYDFRFTLDFNGPYDFDFGTSVNQAIPFSAAAFCFIKILFSSEVASLSDLSSRTSPVERLRGFRNVTILISLLFSLSVASSSVLLGSTALHFRSLIFAQATSRSSLDGGEFGPPTSAFGFFFRDFFRKKKKENRFTGNVSWGI